MGTVIEAETTAGTLRGRAGAHDAVDADRVSTVLKIDDKRTRDVDARQQRSRPSKNGSDDRPEIARCKTRPSVGTASEARNRAVLSRHRSEHELTNGFTTEGEFGAMESLNRMAIELVDEASTTPRS